MVLLWWHCVDRKDKGNKIWQKVNTSHDFKGLWPDLEHQVYVCENWGESDDKSTGKGTQFGVGEEGEQRLCNKG